MPGTPIPVVLFAYSRADYLERTLACLRENEVPLIYAFCDGPKTPAVEPATNAVRKLLRGIDWTRIEVIERSQNLGLGRSIRSGVDEVLAQHEAILVFEDDLICVPGTYAYLCAALEHYRDDERVMSVTGWTHPRAIPRGVGERPYFDGRAECYTWGTWRRGWKGMERDARTLMRACARRGIDPYHWGADLVDMAYSEQQRNIWAVRWSFLHILRGGLCLRPPHSLVEHIGIDARATNSAAWEWSQPALQPCPPIPSEWPDAVEDPQCAELWQAALGRSDLRNRALVWMRRGVRLAERIRARL